MISLMVESSSSSCLSKKIRNAMDGSVMHVAVCTELALEVLKPVSKNGIIVSSIATILLTSTISVIITIC